MEAAHVQALSDVVGKIVWVVSIDRTTSRAHQHASGARRRPSRADEKGGRHPADEGARAPPRRADDQGPSGPRRHGRYRSRVSPKGPVRGMPVFPLTA